MATKTNDKPEAPKPQLVTGKDVAGQGEALAPPIAGAIMHLRSTIWFDLEGTLGLLQVEGKRAQRKARLPGNRDAAGAQARLEVLEDAYKRLKRGGVDALTLKLYGETRPFFEWGDLKHAEIMPDENGEPVEGDLGWDTSEE